MSSSFFLNVSTSTHCFTSLGMSFHSRGPITLNDLFANDSIFTLEYLVSCTYYLILIVSRFYLVSAYLSGAEELCLSVP